MIQVQAYHSLYKLVDGKLEKIQLTNRRPNVFANKQDALDYVLNNEYENSTLFVMEEIKVGSGGHKFKPLLIDGEEDDV